MGVWVVDVAFIVKDAIVDCFGSDVRVFVEAEKVSVIAGSAYTVVIGKPSASIGGLVGMVDQKIINVPGIVYVLASNSSDVRNKYSSLTVFIDRLQGCIMGKAFTGDSGDVFIITSVTAGNVSLVKQRVYGMGFTVRLISFKVYK